ncbi:myosin light chain 5 isoform X2 [Bos taurus]|uniref:myosin light chain 5 isoform X2 n=1 Tax=Bos taurus TaxID=9913 RepID=UPI000383EFF6|nr:myosin light chain 5 isoform X2 [Bos taurus]
MLDPDGKGSANKDYSRRQLASQADNMTAEEVDQMFQFSTSGTVGSLGYKALGHMFAPGKRSERHPTPRGCGQLNKCEPTNLPAHKQCLCWAEVSSWGWECPWGGEGLG